ncbi:MAG: hypothetical protein RIS86_1515 [Planctomycetota bacterium]|jgi:predicted nucleotidyltransferase
MDAANRPTPTDESLAQIVVESIGAVAPGSRCLACWFFGSRSAGTPDAHSDLDLAVLCQPPLDPVATFDAAQRIAVATGIETDLVELSRASGVLAMEVILKGRRIVEADPAAAETFATTAFSEFVSFEELRRPVIEAFIASRKAG